MFVLGARRLVACCVTACAVVLGTAAPASAQPQVGQDAASVLQAGLVTTADGFILPAYRAWSAASNEMTDTLTAYCMGSGPFESVEAAFAGTFLAWQRASLIQVGPALDMEAPLRVQLWPDSKGFSRRAIAAARAAEDPAILTEGALGTQSIALPNLTALEILLDDTPQPGSYGCDLATAIARYQATIAAGITSAWTPGAPYRAQFDTAAAGNDRYQSVDDLIREFLAGLVVHTDRLRKFKIQRGLGAETGDARPVRTEALRSGLGRASIETSFRALSDIYRLPGGFFDVTPDLGGPLDYLILGKTAENVANTLSEMPGTLEEIAAEDGDAAETLRTFGTLVTYHDQYLRTLLPQALGFSAGFTSADGD